MIGARKKIAKCKNFKTDYRIFFLCLVPVSDFCGCVKWFIPSRKYLTFCESNLAGEIREETKKLE